MREGMAKRALGIVTVFFVVAAVNSCTHLPDYTDFIKSATSVSTTCDPDTVYFENEIRPLISSNCGMAGCHDAQTNEAGVNVESYAAILNSGLVVSGRPDKSKIVEVINITSGEKAMPPSPRNPLSDAQKARISKWIEQGARNNKCSSNCDSSQFKFTDNVLPIIVTNCNGCHSGTFPSGNLRLENYAQIKTQADNGQLFGTINYSPGYKAMPQAANKMPDCEIAVIRKWIENGAQNN